MIEISLLVLLSINFLAILVLPKIFFRGDGKFNLMWWITGAPFGIALFAVFLQHLSLLPEPFALGVCACSSFVSPFLSSVSIGLICYTLGTHRIPLALWHQENDAPKQIVTWGAYKRIRHPFYASFLVYLISALVAAPNAVALFALIYGFIILNVTAAREERRLSASEFGAEYGEYMKKSGRFFPRLGS